MKNAIFLLTHFFLPIIVVAQFAEPVELNIKGTGNFIYLCDLDNSGANDVLYNGCMAAMNVNQPGSNRISLEACSLVPPVDFNGDGFLDLVYLEGNAMHIGLFDGDQSFNSMPLYPSYVNYLCTADFDNDTYIDIASGTMWFKNDGNGTFEAIDFSDFNANNNHAVDMNQDGWTDIVLVWGTNLYWRENQNGSFGDMVSISIEGNGNVPLDFVDFDNDGDIDVLYGDNDGFKWVENLGNLVFADADVLLPLDISSYSLADADGDGDFDLLFSEGYNNQLVISEYEEPFGYTGVEYLIPDFPNGSIQEVEFMDFDGDGLLDIVANIHDNTCLFTSLGDFTFDQMRCINGNIMVNQILVNDANGDGLNDLSFTSGEPYDFHGETGAICLAQGDQFHFGHPDFFASAIYPMGSLLTLGHLDNGNLADVAIHSGDSLHVLLNQGEGILPLENTYTAGGQYASFIDHLIIIDFESDGDNDICLSQSDNQFFVWFNDGNGQFSNLTELEIDNLVTGSFDMNNDGHADFYTPTGFALNNEGASFTFTGYTTNFISNSDNDENALISADLNDDGFPDLAGLTASNVIAYYNNGNEGLGSAVVLYPFPAQAIISADFDLDSDIDIVIQGTAEMYFIENLGEGSFAPSQDFEGNFDVGCIVPADFDSDGDMDILLSHNGTYTSLQYFIENETISGFQISGNVFYDINSNGILDGGEQGFDAVQLDIVPDGALAYTGFVGNYFFAPDAPGTYALNASLEGWQNTSPSPLDVEVSVDFPTTTDHNFGFVPITEATAINFSFNSTVGLCSQQQPMWLSINNIGTTTPDALVTLTLDDNILFISAYPPPTAINGQTLTWNFFDLYYFSQELISLTVEYPSADFLGETFFSTAQVELFDGLDNPILYDSAFQPLVCAYDPNFKEEHTGLTPLGYVNGSDAMEYTLHFQNTGNAPATNVMLRDQLSEQLNWNSLELVSWSHPVNVNISNNGLAEFSFQQIMLPDSASDPQGSHGFISFRINPVDDIAHATEIENVGNIFFDLNPPITTNTTINTIFDCDTYAADILQNTATDCFLQNVEASFESEWTEFVQWSIDGNVISSASEIVLDEPGTLLLHLDISNSLCGTRSDSVFVTISEVNIPEISSTALQFCEGENIVLSSNYEAGNTWILEDVAIGTSQQLEVYSGGIYELVVEVDGCISEIVSIAIEMFDTPEIPEIEYLSGTLQILFASDVTYQWYLDNEAIDGATLNYYTPSISGDYIVAVTGLNGCTATSDGAIVFVDITEITDESFQMFPNPAHDYFTLQLSAQTTFDLHITTTDGRTINHIEHLAGAVKIETKEWKKGVYCVKATSENGVVSNKRIVIL